jgi:hypothetical protein
MLKPQPVRASCQGRFPQAEAFGLSLGTDAALPSLAASVAHRKGPDRRGFRTERKREMTQETDINAPSSDAIPFDNFEVQGVIRRRRTIPVDDTDAEYWTIIGYISGKQVCSIGRFASRAEAEEVCKGLHRHRRSA